MGLRPARVQIPAPAPPEERNSFGIPKRVKIASIITDVPVDPYKLRDLTYEYLYEVSRTLVGSYRQDLGLILSIIDVEPLQDAFRSPTDCRIYLRLRIKAVVLDVEANDVLLGRFKKAEGRFVEIGLGSFLSGMAHVNHLGDTRKYRFKIDPNQGRVTRTNKETGETEEYMVVGDAVRVKVTGGKVSSKLQFSMRGDRLGPIKVIKKKREEVMNRG